jgi:fructose-1,6-bisphosphatase/inositol monophosphatase family enzyme
MEIAAGYLDKSGAALKAVTQSYRARLLDLSGSISHNMKADKTPVTELDLEIESAVRKALSEIDPAVGFEGEEHGIEGSRDTYWLIDPIDGTEQFVRGIPAFRTMCTLVQDGKLQYTFVYDYPKDELFTARHGLGSKLNGQPVSLSSRPLDRAWVEFTTNLTLPEPLKMIPVIRRNARGLRITGDFTQTLKGQFEGHVYYKANGSTWDWTPWALLIKEAGGKVANFGSKDYDYRDPNFLAATPEVFDALKPLLDQALQEAGAL